MRENAEDRWQRKIIISESAGTVGRAHRKLRDREGMNAEIRSAYLSFSYGICGIKGGRRYRQTFEIFLVITV